jgi:hypothetical protein
MESMPLELINLVIGIMFLAMWAIAARILMRQYSSRGDAVKTSAAYRRR